MSRMRVAVDSFHLKLQTLLNSSLDTVIWCVPNSICNNIRHQICCILSCYIWLFGDFFYCFLVTSSNCVVHMCILIAVIPSLVKTCNPHWHTCVIYICMLHTRHFDETHDALLLQYCKCFSMWGRAYRRAWQQISEIKQCYRLGPKNINTFLCFVFL